MTSTDLIALDKVVSSLPDGPEFTTALSIPETAGQVSAVIATYNRCPFDPDIRPISDNPLTWALDSLLAQAGDALAEIIVVDDCSTDHTPAVLARYTRYPRPGEVRVTGIRLGRHAGTAVARNTGTTAVRGRWVLFGDDDCVFSPHYAAGAAYLMHALSERNPTTAGAMLPFYYRALRPRDILPAARIGVLTPETAEFATRFHTWPAEYMPHPPRLDDRSGLLAPLRVRLIGGTAILDLGWLLEAGGFRDLSSAWRSSYSDHLHLSADLTDVGAMLCHCPDPRASAAHLKFGAAGRFPLDDTDLATVIPALQRPFAELVELASQPRTDTGCRVSDALFHAEMIGAFFAFFAGRSAEGGLAWAVRMWREFVQDGQVHSLTVTERPARDDRETAWREGLQRGARFLTEGIQPGRSPDEVVALTVQIGEALGQSPVRPW
ncbi:MAG: glycosyltransferase family 2 protein [Pseudonocardiaceae bacterium]